MISCTTTDFQADVYRDEHAGKCCLDYFTRLTLRLLYKAYVKRISRRKPLENDKVYDISIVIL